MNEALLKYLESRRTIPANFLAEPGPDRETIRNILTIAARVPDHGKLAPWRFIVIEGEARLKLNERFRSIALLRRPDLSGESLQAESTRFDRAPVVVAVVSSAVEHPKIPKWEQILSAGASCMALLMAANAYGFSASWLTEWMADDEDALAPLRLSDDESIAGFIHIGTPTAPPTERPRPALDDIVTWLDDATG
ncbi:nitroreductase [Hoeflea sp. WL0058]|uniref:Putative NAD(P)H nitroreductase n=1 Tax=Flavimaribacter sediminis TaxID=2865987 RepID=A0AAE3D0I6_9HYPH|nr:nitroreductase [Flavimaribacter sediminis]